MLDSTIHYLNYGVYMRPNPTTPVIPHPIVPLIGNLFYVLSFRAEADGTREDDWYLVNNQGVRPVCTCRAWNRETGCKHCTELAAQMPALIPQVDALLAADRADRRAARLAREAARGQNPTEGIVIPPPTKQVA